MPLYNYICPKCNKITERINAMSDFQNKINCSCGSQANHSIALDHASGNSDSQMKAYDFEGSNGTRLYPCAILNRPEDIAEFRSKCPSVDLREHNGFLIPRVHNRTEKLSVLKQLKMEEKD